MGKADHLRADLASIEDRLVAQRRHLGGLVAVATEAQAAVVGAARSAVEEADRHLAHLESALSPPHALAWDHEAWSRWDRSQGEGDRGRLRVGAHLDRRSGHDLHVADTVGLVGSGRSLLITSRGPEQAAQAEALLQSLVARLALAFREGASFVLLEPAHSGGPLVRMAKALLTAKTASSRDQVRVALEEVTARIERIGTEHLSSTRPTFEDLPEREQLDIGLQFVVASEFPSRLSEREIEALDVAANDGPEKGTYVIVHWHLDEELPITVRRAPFTASTRIDVGARQGTLAGAAETTTRFDAVGAEVEAHLHGIERTAPASRAVTWGEAVGVQADQIWAGDASRGITTPLAVGGAGDDTISVTFGTDADGEAVSHGVVAGQTGKGKSRLLHALLCGLAVRYSPEEVGFYLIDGKSGLEFEAYRGLPHARVVSLHTAPALARSVLSELEVEMGRRAKLFTDAGVNDLANYRAGGGPERRLPRILCAIDEFQEVFQEGGEDEGMRLLSLITAQGRAYGIHLLVASQSFQPSGLRNPGKFYGNVALRMALPLDRAELEAVDLFGGAAGRKLVIDTCTTGGRVVINDRSGRGSHNRPGRVAFITDDEVTALVATLAQRAEDGGRYRPPVVFHGGQAPSLRDHPMAVRAQGATTWPSEEQLTTMARRPCSAGGLGHDRWQAGERPVLAALGRALDVHGQTSAMLRRAAAENVLLVGSSEPERVGMLLGALTVMAMVHPPSRLELAVLDRSFPGSDHSSLLTDVVARLAHGRHPTRVVGPTGGGAPGDPIEDSAAAQAALVESVAAEVERRRALPEVEVAQLPSLVFVGHDLDRCDALRQVEDAYGSSESELGARLSLVFGKGPPVGVHSLCSFAYVGAVTAVVGTSGLNQAFRHRVALQMSDDESFELLRSSAASKLPSAAGEIGARQAVTALYLDRQSNVAMPFKPYTAFAVDGTGSIVDDVTAVTEQLARWGTA
ncbi:MAG TPA: FtsK/SpoIIIE domain-containing protein [Acidimicrobiales bacterium]|nr:FtsK/SpoIIIE domain-containing protein [Acidimicrobiales bacterium]